MKHYLGICLVLLTVAAIALFVMHSCTTAIDQGLGTVTAAFAKELSIQPQVSINQRVVLTQTAPIAELAVVTKEELITIGMNEHLEVLSFQIPLTEKKITAEAVYRIKAGFDLRQPFSVEINPATKAVTASMPHAEILSVEQLGDITYHGEDAVLNRITDTERTQILSNLNGAAHDAAEKSTLKADAEEQVTQRLDEIMKHNGQSFQVEWVGKNVTPSSHLP